MMRIIIYIVLAVFIDCQNPTVVCLGRHYIAAISNCKVQGLMCKAEQGFCTTGSTVNCEAEFESCVAGYESFFTYNPVQPHFCTFNDITVAVCCPELNCSVCENDLVTCNGNLGTCNSNFGTCTGNLNDCQNPTCNISNVSFRWIGGTDMLTGTNGVYGIQGVFNPINIPGSRVESMGTKIDKTLYVFGGAGFPETGVDGLLNDLWEHSLTIQQWRYNSGSKLINQNSNYGTKGGFSISNVPGSRIPASMWSSNTNLYLFGGNGLIETGVDLNFLNDLWEYSIFRQQWRWLIGSSLHNQLNVVGTKGKFDPNNTPAATFSSFSWTKDTSLYLFIGSSIDGEKNNLWEFDITIMNWRLLNGTDVANSPGSYGIKGKFDPNNTPGSRSSQGIQSNWIVGNSLYLFGGSGRDESGANGRLNDLWEFNLLIKNWRWISGTKTRNSIGVYGTQNIFDSNNVPGGRLSYFNWIRGNSLFVYGGNGLNDILSIGQLSDFWEFSLTEQKWRWISGTTLFNQPMVRGNLNEFNSNNTLGVRGTPVFWSVDDSFYVFSGSSIEGMYSDLWEITVCSTCDDELESCNSNLGIKTTCCDEKTQYCNEKTFQLNLCNGNLTVCEDDLNVCQNPTCAQTCANGGSCVATDVCQCAVGWEGSDCTTAICVVGCQHGTCTSPANCDCNTGWSGGLCDTPICSSGCVNGVCSAPDTCVCNIGYVGTDCSEFTCNGVPDSSPFVCGGHGDCTGLDTCTCNAGYDLPYCQTFDCFGLTDPGGACNGIHGICVGPDNCDCNTGYNGPQCTNPIGEILNNCTGLVALLEQEIFNLEQQVTSLISDLNACNIDKAALQAQIIVLNNAIISLQSQLDTCNLEKDGLETQILSLQAQIIALQSQVTTLQNDLDTCNSDLTQCQSDFSLCGTELATAQFDLAVCDVNLVTCNTNLGTQTQCCNDQTQCCNTLTFQLAQCNSDLGTCQIDLNDCQNPTCSPVCGSHGTCVAENTCKCADGWWGAVCDQNPPVVDDCETCLNTIQNCVTAGHACFVDETSCTNGPNTDCEADFEACVAGCENFFTYNPVTPPTCSFEDITIHECPTPPDCTLTCFGVNSKDPAVCSGNGVCTNNDVCTCQPGYYGTQCENWDCFGTAHNNAGVCNSHGQCVAPDLCKCNVGWSTEQCQAQIAGDIASLLQALNPTCFGRKWDESGVCGKNWFHSPASVSRGICVADDTCLCFCGYNGDKCQHIDWPKIHWCKENGYY